MALYKDFPQSPYAILDPDRRRFLIDETLKDCLLGLIGVSRKCQPGRRKTAVKVVDLFGNDTMKIVEVEK